MDVEKYLRMQWQYGLESLETRQPLYSIQGRGYRDELLLGCTGTPSPLLPLKKILHLLRCPPLYYPRYAIQHRFTTILCHLRKMQVLVYIESQRWQEQPSPCFRFLSFNIKIGN